MLISSRTSSSSSLLTHLHSHPASPTGSKATLVLLLKVRHSSNTNRRARRCNQDSPTRNLCRARKHTHVPKDTQAKHTHVQKHTHAKHTRVPNATKQCSSIRLPYAEPASHSLLCSNNHPEDKGVQACLNQHHGTLAMQCQAFPFC